jgi:tRNA-Thr(GGU) m(6)t(6)A37 methyltransferase TsaA
VRAIARLIANAATLMATETRATRRVRGAGGILIIADGRIVDDLRPSSVAETARALRVAVERQGVGSGAGPITTQAIAKYGIGSPCRSGRCPSAPPFALRPWDAPRMQEPHDLQIRPIGIVRSRLRSLDEAPRQSSEGAPDAWLELAPAFAKGLDGIGGGAGSIVLPLLHRADRTVLRVHPRDETERPLAGVFATRSPDRPNPIGLHRVTVLEVRADRGIRVDALEAIDGTPIADIKPVLRGATGD